MASGAGANRSLMKTLRYLEKNVFFFSHLQFSQVGEVVQSFGVHACQLVVAQNSEEKRKKKKRTVIRCITTPLTTLPALHYS